MASSRDQAQLGQKAASKAAGESIEAEVLQLLPELVYVGDSTAEWHDARVDELLTPSDDVVFASIVLLEVRTPVEIKAAQVRLASGRRGRYLLRRTQHERLLAEGASYLFAVYEPRSKDVLAMVVIPASIVDELLPDEWTVVDREHRETPEEQAQLAWSRVVNPETVEETA